jgi:hypothetical protein
LKKPPKYGTYVTPRSIPMTDEQWGKVYQYARLDMVSPGAWVRELVLKAFAEREK